MMAAISIKILRFFGVTVIAIFALATLGSLVPKLPLLGPLGPNLLSIVGPWIVVFSLIAAILWVRDWRAHRHRRAVLWAAIAGFAAVGTVFVEACQIQFASAQGVGIDIGQTFTLGLAPDKGGPPETVNYGSHDGESLPLDIYRPTQPGGALSPVLVYIHGGGWGGQTLKQRPADFHWFVDRGFLVISLEYSLSSTQRHQWDVVQPELGCALVWIAENAARYGGDVSRIALIGESAGGNLVLNVSYMANQGALKPSCAGTLPHVAATIALYPVVDVVRFYRNDIFGVGLFGRAMATGYTGGSPEEFPDRYAYVSSPTHISPMAPATLLIVPQADHLVDPAAADAFAVQARASGIDISLIGMPYAEHGFDLTSGNIGNQVIRQATLRFLSEHGVKP